MTIRKPTLSRLRLLRPKKSIDSLKEITLPDMPIGQQKENTIQIDITETDSTDTISHTSSFSHNEEEIESSYCSKSRCGFSDQFHHALISSGKWLYDCLGDPPNDETADYLVGVSEISEEGATFCCLRGV
ncbi:hypothetical protein HJC23_004420 [Cyclotella cryptica]|uniref:Uncharacterized protein n=1 Tax=Cyclotella cryptica TaxID=29204 RepID=A0ABD3QE33_9STRA